MTRADDTAANAGDAAAPPLPRWFLLEVRSQTSCLEPTEEAIRADLLDAALPMLRSPRAAFIPLDGDSMLVRIDSPDACLDLRVRPDGIAVTVQVTADILPVIRFCEALDAQTGGEQRLRVLPEGDTPPFGDRPSGYLFGRVIEQIESDFQTISLVEHPSYGRALLLGDEIQIGARDEHIYSGTLVAHGVSDQARSVLIIGGGDCGVLREVLSRPVERVVMVELDPAVVRFCVEHLPEVVGDALEDPRAEVHFEDAFAFLETCEERFDVVISDLTDKPISRWPLGAQLDLMCRALAPGGSIATHAERDDPRDETHRTVPMVVALSERFEDVAVIAKRIPTFQDQAWLFVRASGQRFR